MTDSRLDGVYTAVLGQGTPDTELDGIYVAVLTPTALSTINYEYLGVLEADNAP